jgi:hypothetical protein
MELILKVDHLTRYFIKQKTGLNLLFEFNSRYPWVKYSERMFMGIGGETIYTYYN